MSSSNNLSRCSAFIGYKCCKSKPFIHYVCVKCHNVFHKSCLPKHLSNIRIIKENKIICCKTNEETNFDDDNEKSVLEKTISELAEDSEIKNNYIQKLKNDNRLFVEDAMKSEEEMNEQIRKHEKTILELKEHIHELKNCINKSKKVTKTTGTQTDKNTKNVYIATDPSFTKRNKETTSMAQSKSHGEAKTCNQAIFKNNESKIMYQNTTQTKQSANVNIQGRSKNNLKKNKILILSDECGRNCNRLIKKYKELESYEITSIIKPGALLWQIIENIDSLCKNYTINDFVIIIAGTNDINKKSTPSFRYICNKLKLSSHTNIIFTSILYKKNRINSFLKNRYIHKYNSKLNEFLTKFNKYAEGNISYLEVNPPHLQDYSPDLMSQNIKNALCSAKHLPKKNLKFIHATHKDGVIPSDNTTITTLCDSVVEIRNSSVDVSVNSESSVLRNNLSLDQEFTMTISQDLSALHQENNGDLSDTVDADGENSVCVLDDIRCKNNDLLNNKPFNLASDNFLYPRLSQMTLAM